MGAHLDHGATRPILDPATVACLGDGWHAAFAVDTDGTAWPWLMSPGCECESEAAGHPPAGCRGQCCAPHDQTGRLPRHVRARVWPCLAATRSGAACRNPAPAGTDRCAQHRGWATRQESTR